MAEIDKLNRSRRAIKEFNSVREEVEDLKITQKELRDQRDLMFKVLQFCSGISLIRLMGPIQTRHKYTIFPNSFWLFFCFPT